MEQQHITIQRTSTRWARFTWSLIITGFGLIAGAAAMTGNGTVTILGFVGMAATVTFISLTEVLFKLEEISAKLDEGRRP